MSQSLPAGRETAKQRALRVPLQYVRKKTPLDYLKWAAAIVGCLLGSGYVAWTGFVGGESAKEHLSPMPVASVHASLKDGCSACHQSLTPLGADADGVRLLFTAFSKSDQPTDAHHGADANCLACHKNMPDHQSNVATADVAACATCHQEHRGAEANLNWVSNRDCTACHAKIDNHRKGDSLLEGPAEKDPLVTRFAQGSHPAFRSLGTKAAPAVDPGNLKFNHALHANLSKIAPRPDAAAYNPAWYVDQKCDACHVPDSGRPTAADDKTQQLGAIMQPIRYEQHCARCHPTTLVVQGVPSESQGAIPHGLQPAEIREVLRGRFAAPSEGSPRTYSPRTPLDVDRPAPIIPGKTLGGNIAQQMQDEPSMLIARVEAALSESHRCGKCHVQQNRPTDDDSGTSLMAAFAPTAIPKSWLKHARFDHAAHRAMDCRQCHAAAYAEADGPVVAKLDGETPMIPNLDNCLQCHSADKSQVSPPLAGQINSARSDCVECHRYHVGPPPGGR